MNIKEKPLLILLWSLNAILVLLVVIPISELPAIFQFVGRLHPLVLHFPIVLILASFLFEVLAHRANKPAYAEPASLLLWLGAFSAVFSAIAGYLLSVNGGYGGNTFAFHQWFGLATSVIAALLIQIRENEGFAKLFIPAFGGLTILLIVTGHYGASLTHGEDFLTEVFEESATSALVDTEPIFTQVVKPILESKCTSCHNPNKIKGGLSLASAEEIMKGGENGAILKPGDVLNSTFTSHLILPTEDKLHMPPKGKAQLSNEEIKMLEYWVASGGSFSQLVNEIPAEDPVQTILAGYFTPEEPLDIDFVSAQTLSSLNTSKVSIKQIENDKPYLEAYVGQHDSLQLAEIKSLRNVREQVYSLDLGGSRIDKSIMKEVAKFENLHRLYLDNTAIDDAMIGSLRKLKNLEYLNLYGTNITRKGAAQMLGLESLEKLYLWQTKVNAEDLEELKSDYPDAVINGGSIGDTTFEEVQLNTPRMVYESSFFDDKMTITVPYSLSNTDIYYQIGNDDPQILQGREIELTASSKVTVYAKKEGWKDSEKAEQAFILVRPNRFKKNDLKFDPKGTYKAKGIETLFDLKKGSENFRDGNWLGFNGDDMIVDVELSETRSLESVFISTLDDTGSWIFPPTELEIWGGSTSGNLKKLNTLSISSPDGPEPKHMIIHELTFDKADLKYVRVIAKNYGDLPDWHPGKDTPAWLFIDEIAFQ
ncbi:c-type cytochrome domain-containing protein [Roseivirga sp. E12]|uniref:c-type cytochrome domain-containing protein n=1 Tax=Roseivirga sp. E12 TaxID=2819237 RepID=UPI001ABC51DC|nr:c-type cytochrome domain-containing protein [Roseivirga sp. E12]MBO3699543.1 hypothetical protein [Roseivirga sp. E12]